MCMDELLEEILNEPTIPDIVNNGKIIAKQEFEQDGKTVRVTVYDFNSTLYASSYVDEECIFFDKLENVKKKFSKTEV